MRALLLPDLALALAHLLDEKAEVLGCTLCGQMYRPRLVAQLGAIEALPPVGPTGRPLAEALDEAELRSDTVALLSDLRAAVTDELFDDPQALDQIEQDLFGFIDMLAADREAGVRRRTMAASRVSGISVMSDAAPPVE